MSQLAKQVAKVLADLPINGRAQGKWLPDDKDGAILEAAFMKGYSAEFICNLMRETDPEGFVPSPKTLTRYLREERGVDTSLNVVQRAQAYRQANPT